MRLLAGVVRVVARLVVLGARRLVVALEAAQERVAAVLGSGIALVGGSLLTLLGLLSLLGLAAFGYAASTSYWMLAACAVVAFTASTVAPVSVK